MNNSIPVVHAPVVQQKEKLDSVTLAAPGFHIARCYSVVDLGLQHSTKFNKWSPKIEYVFELLDHRQKFYEDDEGIRPTVVSTMHTNSMSKNANLRKYAVAAFGKDLSDTDADAFNVYEFADKIFMIQISHSKPNSEGVVYENIIGIAPFNPSYATGVDITPHNELLCFHIATHGFNSPNYAFLPGFKKGLIDKSQEAMDHKKNNGKFADRSDFETEGAAQGPAGQRQNPNQGQAPNAQQTNQASSQKPAIILLTQDYTLEEFRSQNWTDKGLVDAGYAKWAPKAPAPAPQGPPPPTQGAPVPPAGAPPYQNNPNLAGLTGGDLPDDDVQF